MTAGGADVVVVGAGPAGVSAALWGRSLGLKPLLIDAGEVVGGQLHHVHFELPNLPGAVGGTGRALAGRMREQLELHGVELRLGTEARALDPRRPRITVAGGDVLEARAIVVATGVRRRRLEVPGARELEGRGVSYSATGDLGRLAGHDVVVVGGGDAAYENALILAAAGCAVTLLVRGASRARPEFQQRVAGEPRIETLLRTRVTEVLGAESVAGVRALMDIDGREIERPCSAVVVKIGMVPNTEWCRTVLAVDPGGFLAVGPDLRTSHGFVWAAGDVTRPVLFAAAIALGQGAQAMEHVRRALAG